MVVINNIFGRITPNTDYSLSFKGFGNFRYSIGYYNYNNLVKHKIEMHSFMLFDKIPAKCLKYFREGKKDF